MPSLEQFLRVALLTPIFDPTQHRSPADPGVIWGVPVNLIGLSGIAKTARIKAIGRSLGLPTHSVFVPTKQPEDFVGAYVPTPDGLVIECVLPAARKCLRDGRGCIHLSELSCARPAVQAALLSVVNERQVGDHVLPPKTRFLIDMNPTEYAAGGYALEAAMANRMAHKAYPNPPKGSLSKFLRGKVESLDSIQSGEQQVVKNWVDHWGTMVAMQEKFELSVEESVIINQPKPEDPHSGEAWPSLRTWHYAICASVTARCLGMKELEDEFVECLVGEGPATAWATFKASADLPAPRDMLTRGWKPDTRRLDRTAMSLTAMTEYLKSLSETDRADAIALAPNAWRLLAATAQEGMADIAMDPVQTLLKAKLGRRGAGAETEEAAEDVIEDLSRRGLVTMAS